MCWSNCKIALYFELTITFSRFSECATIDMKNYFSTLCALLALYFSLSGTAISREFEDLKGRKINASVLEVTDGKVKLKLDKSGKIYTLKLNTLSKSDVKFLQDWQKKNSRKDPVQQSITTEEFRRISTTQLMERFDLSENFDAKWPSLIKSSNAPDIKVVKEDDSSHQYIYHSQNYEFICDVKLSMSVVKKFAVLFETSRNYCHEIPLSLMKAHIPGESYRNRVMLFETRKAYVKNGGSEKSAGMYYSGTNAIYVPLTSLGVKKRGSTYVYDYKKENSTLSHELVHQLTDPEYYAHGARGWFTEGLAEYVSMTPYRGGRFSVNNSLKGIKLGVTKHGKKGKGGRALGTKINAPDLKGYMLQPYSSFTKNSNLNYGLAALITYYYFHLDGNKDRANINAFLKALKQGKRGEEALNVLLNGRSWDEMEKQIAKAWSSRGVKIHFK